LQRHSSAEAFAQTLKQMRAELTPTLILDRSNRSRGSVQGLPDPAHRVYSNKRGAMMRNKKATTFIVAEGE